jgi:hypothetical protein
MFLERLTRRSEGLIMRDGKGGVCFVGDFYKKIRKKFKIPSFCPLIISTEGGRNDQQHGLITRDRMDRIRT